jgi:hypothetical protein
VALQIEVIGLVPGQIKKTLVKCQITDFVWMAEFVRIENPCLASSKTITLSVIFLM